jgi:serine/threonine-protein kinase
VLVVGVKRLWYGSLTLAAAFGAYLLVGGLAARADAALGERYDAVAPALAVGLVLSLLMAALTRSKLEPRTVAHASCGYLMCVCLAAGLVRHLTTWQADDVFSAWSPVAFIVVLYSALVPMRASNAFAWGLAGAAMDPFSMFLLRTRLEMPSVPAQTVLLISPVFAAGASVVVSWAIYGLMEGGAKNRGIGGYRLVKLLGQGAMGEVWQAAHVMLTRAAAIKLIRPKVLTAFGEEEARRILKLFQREAQATAALTNPHTILIYDYGVTDDGAFYYVMELLNGLDLQNLVEEFGPQRPARAVHLLRQACYSLAEAHEAGLVHRDLKPANIYTCRYGGEHDFVKVLDFGLVLDRRPTAEELEEEGIVGTPAIMAPEQMRFGAPVDQRVDIYALGCVGYWLLTGLRVFDAMSRADMLVMHSHQRPDPPSKRKPETSIPPEVEQLIMQCLEKNPNKRPQTARELGSRLDEIQRDLGWTEEAAKDWWTKFRPGPKPEAPEASAPDNPSPAS